MKDQAEQFLAAQTFAVAGASNNHEKYGYKVFRALRDSNRNAVPIHPLAPIVDDVKGFAHIQDIPHKIESLSIITPPEVTQRIVDEAIAAGVANIWMQPGAEHNEASEKARAAGINVIDDGSCILVALSYERHRHK